MRSLAVVVIPAVLVCAAHARVKIRQVKPRTGNRNRQRVACVQAEKPHAGLAIAGHIGSDIQFRECGKPRKRRRPA
ncbi:MAG: hypothetical protein AUH11_04550 [Acidobacteria bacterium 13_2_20CM_57_17]|nr:MAG: hypothetical protein AUH11_04550 [Acidobacteria bacterium 13_2_20CM_57_17]